MSVATFDKLEKDMYQLLENPPPLDGGFVYAPNIHDSKFTGEGKGGWKLHVGIGIRNLEPSEKQRVTQNLQELTKFLERYSDRLTFKFAGFETMRNYSTNFDRKTGKPNLQKGKQITIYIPKENEDLIPIISRNLEYFIDKHEDLYLVEANKDRNISLAKNGVISIRWSSYFSPRDVYQLDTDKQERDEGASYIIKKEPERERSFSKIYQDLHTLEKAKYMDRYAVENLIKLGRTYELKGSIVISRQKTPEGEMYFTNLIEDVIYTDRESPTIRVKALEGPYAGKNIDLSLGTITRKPEKLLYKNPLLILIPIILSIFFIFPLANYKITGEMTSINPNFFISFLFLIFLVLVFIIKINIRKIQLK